MQQLLIQILLLLNNVLQISNKNPDIETETLLWTWNCENDKCIPVKTSQSQEKLRSLEKCNMLCSQIQLWPLPTGLTSQSPIPAPVQTSSFKVKILEAPSNIVHQHLLDSFQLFKQDLRRINGKVTKVGQEHAVSIRISVNEDEDPRLRMDTDESYQLSVELTNSSIIIADIVAASFCGARHGLETMLQLIWFDQYIGSLLILHNVIINDAPKFSYRGLMIDTTRNYIPLSELMRTIDAMAASKLNTFHWHAIDSQSVSLHLSSTPHLNLYRACGPSEYYAAEQIKALVRRATLRGIRVLIEIDAHETQFWSQSSSPNHENIVQCINTKLLCGYSPRNNIDPPSSFVSDTILGELYSEIIQLTGVDDIFHVGGDELFENCWGDNFNGSDPNQSRLEFIKSNLQILERAIGKLPNATIYWFSRPYGYIKNYKQFKENIAFQIHDVAWSKKGVKGLRTVLSHKDVWDLNSGYGAWYESASKMFNSWQRFYEHRPWVGNYKGEILGGEATLWSRAVGDGRLHDRVWPRAAALAERLWSDRAEGATRSVYSRLDTHRARLVARGLPCPPIWSHWCTQHPYTCN